MELKYQILCALAAMAMKTSLVSCEYDITDCQKYREIYEAFSSCALTNMFSGTDSYEYQQLVRIYGSNVINKQDFIHVVNYWCNVLAKASTCTDGKALHCSNRVQIHALISKTGGLCEFGRINEEFESIVPEAFSYDKTCEDHAMDIVETCEDQVPEMEYDVNIENGVDEMRRNIEQILKCNAIGLRKSPSPCVSSGDSLLLYAFRALSYSVPHALGIDLNVTNVIYIIAA